MTSQHRAESHTGAPIEAVWCTFLVVGQRGIRAPIELDGVRQDPGQSDHGMRPWPRRSAVLRAGYDQQVADWAEEICRPPLDLRRGGTALHLFGVALAHLDVRAGFLTDVQDCLREHDELVDVWRGYSADKRTPSGPYFGRDGFDLEVGFYDGGFMDVTRHGNAVDACADFIYREAAWILRHARVG